MTATFGMPPLEDMVDNGAAYTAPIQFGGRLRSRHAPYLCMRMNMPNDFNEEGVEEGVVPFVTIEDGIPAGATTHTDATLRDMWTKYNMRLPLSAIVQHIAKQPVGTRTNINLTGHTMGQIVLGCVEAGINLQGYTFSGLLRKIIPVVTPDINHDVRKYAWEQEEFSIAEFPLDKVELPYMLTEIGTDAYRDMDIHEYLEAMRYAVQGSELTYLILWEKCHIKRRTGPGSELLSWHTFSTQTGGFAQLLTYPHDIPFTYENCPVFDPNGSGKVVRTGRRRQMSFAPLHAKVYIPDGSENCVQASIRHVFSHRADRFASWAASSYESGNSGSLNDPPSLNSLNCTWEELQRRDGEIIDSLFDSFSEKFIDEKLRTKKYQRLKCNNAEKRDRALTAYRKQIKGGYSNTFLRKIIKHFREESEIILHILYLMYDGSRQQPYSVRDRGESFYTEHDCDKTHLLLVQMRLDGSIFSNYDGVQVSDPTAGEGEKNYLGFLHMIGLYVERDEVAMDDQLFPLLIRKKPRSSFYPGVLFLNWLSDTILAPVLTRVKEKITYNSTVTLSELHRDVSYQLKRESEGKVPTLIFNNTSTKGRDTNDSTLSDRMKLQHFNQNLKQGEYAVVAYDLETVELTMEIMDTIRPEFRQSPATAEDMLEGGYQPVESVVPFSAQWAPVNVSFRGRMADRAREAGVRVAHYRCTDQGIEDKPIEGTSNLWTEDVLLREVETCYGNNVLGECIEEMLVNMARWAHRNGYGFIAAYAHNGCGFDAYVCLRYCTFEILRMLKTSRGILILDYKVPTGIVNPVTHKEIFIPVRLRDTKVWLNGNLKRIAEAFKCPKVWQKIDFPITLINHRNCYNPEVRKVLEVYGENDVRALAWIIRELNYVIGESPWDPASVYSVKPAIVQFVTVMGMVKAATLNHFRRELPRSLIQTLPAAIDLPILRNWLKKATIGGRVEAYARGYISPYCARILQAYMRDDKDTLKSLYSQMVASGGCDMVLDVTSLYPTAQALCPMPTGKLYALSTLAEAEVLISSIGCNACELQCKLCPLHRNDTRGEARLRTFGIVIVKDLVPPRSTERFALYPFCARKLEKDQGLVYTFETNDQIRQRYDDPDIILDIQSYTNVDLYWMRKLGFTFTIIGGFAWETTDMYQSFLLDAFELRKKAKEQGNAVMSEFIKLQINGSYGVTAQGDIDDSGILVTLPDNLKFLHPSSPEVHQFLHTHRHTQLQHSEYIKDGLLLPNGQTYLSKSKAPGIAEYFSALSPMQIGAAVLAWARHIVNLIIFHPSVTPMKYTDTDSIEITQRSVRFLEEHCPGVIDNNKTAPLGTLKNDHLESCGPGARVFFGIFGTKKVKMYMVITEDGQVHLCTTFKGFNPRMIDDEGMRFHGDHYEYSIAKTLVEIFYQGSACDKEVTSWKRSMDEGIRINHHSQHFNSETYLDRSKGCKFEVRQGNGCTEMFVPFGSPITPEHEFYNTIAHLTDKKGKKKMQIARNDLRCRKLKAALDGQMEQEHIMEFLNKFYSQRESFNLLDNEEFQNICTIIRNNTL